MSNEQLFWAVAVAGGAAWCVALWAVFADAVAQRRERLQRMAEIDRLLARERRLPLGDALLAATIGLHTRPAPYDQDAA